MLIPLHPLASEQGARLTPPCKFFVRGAAGRAMLSDAKEDTMKFFEGKPEAIGINLEAEKGLGLPDGLYDNIPALNLADYIVVIHERRNGYLGRLCGHSVRAAIAGEAQEADQIMEKILNIKSYFREHPLMSFLDINPLVFLKGKTGR